MRSTFDSLRELYNAALQERRDAFGRQGVSVSRFAQVRQLKEVRLVRPEFADIHRHLQLDALIRLDLAFCGFFRRVKAGAKTVGYPRFLGKGRYRSFTFSDAKNHNGVRLLPGGKRVRLAGIGNVKVRLHRSVRGQVKQATVSLCGDGHWYIAIVCDGVPERPLPATGFSVGIDVGISTFAALSDGSMVANPRHAEAAQRKLAIAQRKVSKKRRGSKRRRKAAQLLAKRHDKVRRVRLDFHHNVAADIVSRFDSIAVEKLNIKGLARMRLARQVHDAGWGQFITILASKAECAGREFVAVDPRGTSQECSGCGAVVKKDLGVRVHDCPHCGLVEDRDVNAAINVKGRGQRLRRESGISPL